MIRPSARHAAIVRHAVARCMFVAGLALLIGNRPAAAQYEAPAGYYASINQQTGAALKSQLAAIMADGHVQTSYGEARDYLPFTDANPDNLTQMFEFYTRTVIQKSSASQTGFIGIYNSREHVWPDSRQGPGDTSNATRGSRGDIHMLKPLSSTVNGARGNDPFGGAALTGAARGIGGGYWFPGSVDKGDAARIIFYGATRWGSTLSVVNGTPGTNTQMGDLAALLRFHYQDAPDLFERRRNDAIYRGDDIRTPGDDSSFAGTNNRNAYIDHPEYVWSVFVDQQNDTRLSVGSDVSADGASSLTIDLGRVLRNAPVPAAQNVTINKSGLDGTYYSVTATGSATSTLSGPYNAFEMDAPGSRTFGVGLGTTTAAAGLKSGSVIIDNLDVTTQGGAGRGANDANDVIDLHLRVLAASNGSFAASADVDSTAIDFGTYALGGTIPSADVSIFNLSSTLGVGLTAGLDLDGITRTGATALTSSFSPFTALPADQGRSGEVSLDTAAIGQFSATFSFAVSDENLPGTQTSAALLLTATGRIALGGDVNYDGLVDFEDLLALAQHYGATAGAAWEQGDFDRDGTVDFADLLTLAQHYAGGGAFIDGDAVSAEFAGDWRLALQLVPEPSALLLGGLAMGVWTRRRTR